MSFEITQGKEYMTSIRLAFIDEHPLMCDGVARSLQQGSGLQLVGTGRCAADAIRIADELCPDIMILGVNKPTDGVSAIKYIANVHPTMKLVLLTACEGEREVRGALSSGVKGYVSKGVNGPDLVVILQSVSRGETYVTPTLATRILSAPRQSQPLPKQVKKSSLTARQERILEEIARGLSNKEIALELCLSAKAVKRGVAEILSKLGARNRIEAALISGHMPNKHVLRFSNIAQKFGRRH